MNIQHTQPDAHRGSHHPAFSQVDDDLQDAVSQSAIATHPEDAAFLGQFRPMPLSWLVTWIFRSRAATARAAHSEHEPFEEHINGLA